VISRALAKQLHDAGLLWHPAAGDTFQLLNQEQDVQDAVDGATADVFTVSDMTIEAHDYPTGTVLGFNGTTEWALDSVDLTDALWLPREDQLRMALKSTFVELVRAELPPEWIVTTVFRGNRRSFSGDDAADAYGLALLDQVRATQ
jgi:hypothetical protein